jgi:hypothetical protein
MHREYGISQSIEVCAGRFNHQEVFIFLCDFAFPPKDGALRNNANAGCQTVRNEMAGNLLGLFSFANRH